LQKKKIATKRIGIRFDIKKNKGGWNLKKKNDKQIKLQLKEWGLKLKIKKSYGVKLINIRNLIDYL
jgi:hypothetical protein